MNGMRTTALAAFLAVLASPAAAQVGNQQSGPDQSAQELSAEAQACLDDLRQMDRRLAELGYGRVGPGGYGVYGDPYARAARPVAGRTAPGATGRLGVSTPRADMFALMRAGYIMAFQGFDSGCRQVVEAVRDIGDRYEESIRTGSLDRDALQTWRGDFLASAVPVTEAGHPIRAEDVIGADVRNLRDEDLGDVTDVLLGPDGNIRYAIVARGGFLGIGEDEVPVPWRDLRITPAPHHDTLVLNASEAAFERAPRLDGINMDADGAAQNVVESYWEQAMQDSP